MAKAHPDLVLYADEHLLAVNKPAGLLSLPHGWDGDQPHLRGLLEAQYGPLWMVHRLDRDTSGVLVLARSPGAHRALNEQFARRRVSKVYRALVCGEPEWERYTVRLKLRKNGDRTHRTVIDVRFGQAAATDLRVCERFRGYTLLEAHPRTSRTHQIRAHLGAVDFPLVADALYGDGRSLFLSQLKPGYRGGRDGRRPECALIERPALHAFSLCLAHPQTGEDLLLEAPYPKDFTAALRQLGRYAARRGRA